MPNKKKYYTVWKGHHTGVFESWDDCKAQIKDFKGAQYKSFSSFEAAKKALKGNYKDYIGKSKKFKSVLDLIFAASSLLSIWAGNMVILLTIRVKNRPAPLPSCRFRRSCNMPTFHFYE